MAAVARIGSDFEPSAWLGPELALAVVVSEPFWVGGMLGAEWAVGEGQGRSRNEFRAGLRGGLVSDPGTVVLRGGLGVGFYSGDTSVSGTSEPTGYRDGGPFGEVLFEILVELVGPVHLVLGVDARLSATASPQPDGGSHEQPTPLPTLVGSGRLGLAFDFGDAR